MRHMLSKWKVKSYYCSEGCQSEDWPRHRKEVHELHKARSLAGQTGQDRPA